MTSPLWHLPLRPSASHPKKVLHLKPSGTISYPCQAVCAQQGTPTLPALECTFPSSHKHLQGAYDTPGCARCQGLREESRKSVPTPELSLLHLQQSSIDILGFICSFISVWGLGIRTFHLVVHMGLPLEIHGPFLRLYCI